MHFFQLHIFLFDSDISIPVIVGVVFALLLMVPSVIICKYWNPKQKKKRNEKKKFEKRISIAVNDTMKANQNLIDRTAENRDWSVSLERKLGEGNFGVVYKATLNEGGASRKVAIKQIKNLGNKGQIESLKTEITMMTDLKEKPHPNLAALICHVELDEEATCIVMEYCNLGQLKEYLMKNEKKLLNEATVGQINSKSLCIWAGEVSKGMAYLEERHIMHGDLAARNVLLSKPSHLHPIAKITDFGMAKSFYLYPDYQEVSGNVPWKWMAYEVIALDLRLCSLKSDVWSFGVLLWELFSIGKQPYPEYFQADKKFLNALKDGHFLTCPDELKDIKTWSPTLLFGEVSKLCFQLDKSLRGSFSEITDIINNYLKICEIIHTNNKIIA